MIFNPSVALKDFQKRDTDEILNVIYKYFKNPQDITVLDLGCDAPVTKYLAGHVKKITGINTNLNYLNIKDCPKNVQLIKMDATQLNFPDKSFDFVCSANLYEHIGDLSTCLDEQLRVLKDGGFCYARWDPIWSGCRGHHIHEGMVRWWWQEQKLLRRILRLKGPDYKNNGQFIEDWSHLLLSKDEMFKKLVSKFNDHSLVRLIVKYIYEYNDINRMFFDEVSQIFNDKKIQIIFWEKVTVEVPPEILQKLVNKYKHRDFSSLNSQILFTHAV